jgi:hypothetical protein
MHRKILIFYYQINIADAGKNERRLLQKLFKDYDPSERPIENETQSLDVSVGMAIQVRSSINCAC